MRDIRSIVVFVRSTPAIANWIGGVSLAVWIFKALVLDAIPEPFPRLSAIGGVVDGFLSAIVAGYVFFILFALLPDYRARKIIAPYINNNVRWIVGDCMAVLHELGRVAGIDININTSDQPTIASAFSSAKATAPPNMITRNGNTILPATWIQFLDHRRMRTKKAVAALIDQNRFLEVELISMLTEVDGCSYFAQVEACLGMPIGNADLSFMGDVFWRYLVSCRKLAAWHDSNRLPDAVPLLAIIGA